MGLALKGRKSSSSTSRKATRHDDTLFGQDTVEAILGLGEGPILGLKDGASTFFLGDVPLLDKGTQTPNISNFELRILRGTNPADTIQPNLGGIASTKNVGLDLRVADQTIVVNLDKTQIDYIDLRFVVQQLFAVSPEGGEFPFDVQFKVEVKPRSASTWQIPFNNEEPPPVVEDNGGGTYRPSTRTPGMVVNDAYRETYTQSAQPVAGKAVGAMWFNTGTPEWTPSIWNGAAWVAPTNLTLNSDAGYPVWRWLDFDGAIRQAWYSGDGRVPPPEKIATSDFLLTPATGEQIYSYNDTAWVGFQTWNQVAPAAPGVMTISGLARQAYPKEYRIPVARINEPYDVRVTRISPVSTKTAFRNINFESVQEVIRGSVSFPDLAVAWLTIKATDTFTSIPDMTGIYRGLVIPVPSNYTFDEATKSGTYTGLWDGSFKMAYTNNPAWHAYNFIMNSRYGKNSYYPEVADKWDYYEFGKHCDKYKFRFNEYITEPRSLNELINYIVGIAGGRYIDRGDGYSTVLWDADDQIAQAIFAPENTEEGAFTYSLTDVTEQKNDFKVSFKNPELNYREDRIRVFDQNSIDVQGRNPEEFVAVGCRDPEEAVKRGRLRLTTALTERIIVSFKTNRIGRYLQPFQAILIADDQSTNVISGRIKNPDPTPVGASRLPLRDQIYLEAGISYSAQFTISDGNGGVKVVSYPLTVVTPGLQSELVLSQAVSEALPEYAVFSIGTPKAFRITSIDPSDDNPDIVDITAIEINRLKWAFVNGEVTLRDILPFQTGALSKFVYPPTGAKITPEISTDGKLSLVTTWNATETKLNRGYRVYQSINGEPMNLVYEGDQLLHRQQNLVAGTYVHSIVAVGLDGTTESAPITVQYIVSNAGSLRSVSAPTNLRLVDEPDAPLFHAIDPRFTWDASADPLVTKYRVEVLNGANQVVHGETIENLLLFTYTLAANRADNGGIPLRQFTVRVRAIDMVGNFSDPAVLVVSHPAPIAPSFDLRATSEIVFVETSETTGDWAGTLVFMEEVPGFNPVTTTPKADARLNFFTLPGEPEHTYYVRVAAYDSYGKTGLNYSIEKAIKTTNLLFDPEAPSIPGQPYLVENVIEVAPDGTATTRITLGWPAVTSENLGYYEVWAAEGVNPPEERYVGGRTTDAPVTSMTFTGLMPGQTYNFMVRAHSKNGFAVSDRSPVLAVIAAANTTGPSMPTDFTVDATPQSAHLRWTNPPEKDLRGIEIWAAPVNDGTQATRIAEVGFPGTFYVNRLDGQNPRWFWIRAANTSDYYSGFVGPLQAVNPLISAAQLAADIAEQTMVASGIVVNKVVTAIPATRQYDQITFQGKVYRWDVPTGRYVPLIQAADIDGQIIAAQIQTVNKEAIAAALAASAIQTSQLSGNLDATRIAGQLTGDQITNRALTLAKFADGLAPIETLGALPVTGNFEGRTVYLTTDKKTYRFTGLGFTASVAGSDVTGNISAAQIAGGLTQATIAAGQMTGAIVSTQITDGAITTAKILAGQITSSRLAIVSSNLAYNPDFAQGFQGWATYFGTYPGTEITNYNIGTQWCPSGFKCIQISTTRTGPQPGTQFGVYAGRAFPDGTYDHYPVTENVTYEFSAFMSNHRCTGWLYVDFVRKNANGTLDYLQNSIGVLPYGSGGGQGGSPATYPRIKLIAKAPAGATHATVYFMGRDPVGPEAPFIFVSGFMMAATREGATETSPYVAPGVTTIDGSGILTNSLQAAKIVGGSITTRELNVGNIFADSAVISNISTRVLVANAIKGDMIQATSIGGNKLMIASSNFAYNSDFAQGTRGWRAANGGGGNHGGPVVEAVDPYWCPAGMRAYVTRTAAAPTSGAGYYDIVNEVGLPDNTFTNYTVSQGSRLEISAYVSAHRCSSLLVVGFINAAGNYFVEYGGSRATDNGYSNAQSLEDWNNYARSKLIVTVPTGAVKMRIVIRADSFNPNSQGNSAYLMVSGLMISPLVKSDQTTYSPYVAPSMTTIDGGWIVTDTVVARHIRSDAIETRHMTANTIDAKVLTGGTIVAGKLATNSVEAKNIVAESITAGKLLLSDTSNMLKNGYFLNGSSEGWVLSGDGFVDYADPAIDPSGPYRLTSTTRHPGYSHWIDVTPGDWLYFSCDVYNSHSSGNAGLYIEYYTKALTNGIGRYMNFTGAKNAWTRLETRDQVPAGVQQVRVLPFADVNDVRCWWTKIQVRRASSASLIVDGAITARTLNAGEIFGNQGIFNSLTAGIASFGGLRADQIAAGAITTSKLAISSANMAFNPDLNQGTRGWGRWDGWGNTDATRLSQVTLDTVWAPAGLKCVYVNYDKPLSQIPADVSFGLTAAVMDAGGNITRHPLTADFTYEISCFMSLHRCQGRIYVDTRGPNGEYTGNFQSVLTGGGGIGGSQQDYPRAKLIFKAPPGTASMDLYFMAHTITGDVPYIFVSGLMIASTKNGATETSPYVAPSATLIDGGSVYTGTLHANKIVGESITAAQIGAGQITVDRLNADQLRARIIDTDGLSAARIVVGNNRLSNWVSATDTTRIDGGHLAANSISAQRLLISMRPMTVAGINFEMQVDGNGNKTGWLTWTGGYISFLGDAGEAAGANINAGSVYTGFNETHIWWNRGWSDLSARVGGSDVLDSNRVPMAAWSHFMGLMVLKGGVQIDGDKIAAYSIKAVRIGAGEIQTQHMSANTINGDRILAGTLSADKISTGSITAGQVNVGDWRFQIQGSTRRMRVYGNNSAEHVCIGDISPWVTGSESQSHFGIIIRNNSNQEIMRVGGEIAWIHGAYILQASIGSASIGDLQVTNAKIDNLSVGNSKIADYAVSTLTAASSGGTSTETWTAARTGASKFLILALFNGNSSAGSLAGPGNFIIYRNGTPLINVAASFAIVRVGSENQYYLNSMCIGCIDQPGAGGVSYSCLHTNGQGVGGVTILAMEMSK